MSLFTLRWAGPAMSLGGARIDGHPAAQPIPAPSAVAGLLGAALGLRRGDARLAALRGGLRYAVVVHREGVESIDYQTADLTAAGMRGPMWWRDGSGRVGVMQRQGGGSETAEQWRALRHDADMTLAVELLDGAPFTAPALLAALDEPVFPLYLGRAPCLPGCRVAGALLAAADLLAAVEALPPGTRYLPAALVQPALGDLIAEVRSRDGEIARFVVR
jgi:CRISPR system Cascade subunit CasD